MLLGTLAASLLRSVLTGTGVIRADGGTIRAVRIFNAASSFTKFNGVYSRNELPKIKDRAYVTNLDEYKSIGTHWIV